jgi:hypothetical protein
MNARQSALRIGGTRAATLLIFAAYTSAQASAPTLTTILFMAVVMAESRLA